MERSPPEGAVGGHIGGEQQQEEGDGADRLHGNGDGEHRPDDGQDLAHAGDAPEEPLHARVAHPEAASEEPEEDGHADEVEKTREDGEGGEDALAEERPVLLHGHGRESRERDRGDGREERVGGGGVGGGGGGEEEDEGSGGEQEGVGQRHEEGADAGPAEPPEGAPEKGQWDGGATASLDSGRGGVPGGLSSGYHRPQSVIGPRVGSIGGGHAGGVERWQSPWAMAISGTR